MQCPKCAGQAFLAEEEFVQALENIQPPKLVLKSIFNCGNCGDRFSRIFTHDLEAKAKPQDTGPVQTQTYRRQPIPDTLQFF